MRPGLWFALLLVGSVRAGAEVRPRVAISPPSVSPASPELKVRFHNALTALPTSTVTILGSANGVGKAMSDGADYVLSTSIQVNGKEFSVRMTLANPAGGDKKTSEEVCQICSLKEVDTLLQTMAERSFASLAHREPSPRPPVAPVVPANPNVEPQPLPPPPAAVPSTTLQTNSNAVPFPYRPLAGAAIGVGLIGLAIGIPLIVIDGRPTCAASTPLQSCKEVYSTVAGGGVLVAIGTASLVGAAILFGLDYRARHKTNQLTLFPHHGADFLAGRTLSY